MITIKLNYKTLTADGAKALRGLRKQKCSLNSDDISEKVKAKIDKLITNGTDRLYYNWEDYMK